jgi:hypothetical protein
MYLTKDRDEFPPLPSKNWKIFHTNKQNIALFSNFQVSSLGGFKCHVMLRKNFHWMMVYKLRHCSLQGPV